LLYKLGLLLHRTGRRATTPQTRWAVKTIRRFTGALCLPDSSDQEPNDSKDAKSVIHKCEPRRGAYLQ
jgi:hypothetical protein